MSVADVAQGEVSAAPSGHRGHGAGALTAGVRALFAAVSGLVLTCGVGVVLWAVTPSSLGGPQQSLRAAVSAFAGGNGMTLMIGRASLTLPPLMIMVVAVGLLAGIGGRASRTIVDDRTGEITRTATAAAVYAAVVTTAGVVLGTPGTVAAEQWWRPFVLAFVVVGTTVFLRGRAWRELVLDRTPHWFPVAARLGVAGAVGMVAAGAVALVLALAGSFGNSSTVQTLAAPGPAAGFGMALLGIAYLPNAVVAAAGYASGVGFHIGAGTYSPFGSSPVELPAVSLLAAAPDGRDASRVGMLLLLIPVVVALLLGRAAIRRLGLRQERLLAVGTGAVIAGALVALLAVVAGGGITGGQWATIGAPPLLFGIVTAVLLGVFGAAIAGAARQSVAVETGAVDDVTDADTADADATVAVATVATAADAAEGDAAEGDATEGGETSVGDPAAEQLPADGEQPLDDGEQAGQQTELGHVREQTTEDRDLPDAEGDERSAPERAEISAATQPDAVRPDAGTPDAVWPDDAQPDDAQPDGEGAGRLSSTASDDHPATADADHPAAPGAEPMADADAPAVSATDTGTDAAAPAVTPGTAPGPVPQARREEDVLAESAAPSDHDVLDQLRPRSRPRQVG